MRIWSCAYVSSLLERVDASNPLYAGPSKARQACFAPSAGSESESTKSLKRCALRPAIASETPIIFLIPAVFSFLKSATRASAWAAIPGWLHAKPFATGAMSKVLAGEMMTSMLQLRPHARAAARAVAIVGLFGFRFSEQEVRRARFSSA